MPPVRHDSTKCLQALTVGDRVFTYMSLKQAEAVLGDLSHLPCALRLVLENMLRNEDGQDVTLDDMRAVTAFHALSNNATTITLKPTRVALDGGAALSALVDMAALRDAASTLGGDPESLGLAVPCIVAPDKSILHSAGADDVRSLFLWGTRASQDLTLLPPDQGAPGQLALDALSSLVVALPPQGDNPPMLAMDILWGTDPLMPVAGALGLLAWQADVLALQGLMMGVAAPMDLPHVIGVKLGGKLRKGSGATDIGMAVLKALGDKARGCIIEFLGQGLDVLTVPDRATIAALLATSGCLTSFFPMDHATMSFMSLTGRSETEMALIEAYAKAQGLWRESWPQDGRQDPSYHQVIEIALDTVRPSVMKACWPLIDGPTAPSFHLLPDVAAAFDAVCPPPKQESSPLAPLKHGDILWVSLAGGAGAHHPLELAAAGLIARKALAQGLTIKPWVRAHIDSPSATMAQFLALSRLDADLSKLGFRAGSGGQVLESLQQAVTRDGVAACSLTCAPVTPETTYDYFHALTRAGFVTSPALVVAYALAGSIRHDLGTKPLGAGQGGKPILLKDLWPTTAEIEAVLDEVALPGLYAQAREKILSRPDPLALQAAPPLFIWRSDSLWLSRPAELDALPAKPAPLRNITGARALALFGNDVRADAIAPSGPIEPASPAGQYLIARGVAENALETFAARAGREEILRRGAFRGAGLVNLLAADYPPGMTRLGLSGNAASIVDAAARYQAENKPFIIAAGQRYGIGQGQAWAAKVTRSLGVWAVLAESFDPAHRLNLVHLGVLPLQLKAGVAIEDLKLGEADNINIAGVTDFAHTPCEVMMTIERPDGVDRYMVLARLDRDEEVEMFHHGSLAARLLREHLAKAL